ncbi:unnamed protein product, partial [Ectocarpus sp. 8 AP-2014]
GNPENEELYTDIDRFHMQQDNIKFGGGAGDSSSDSDDLDGSEEEEGVMNLDGAGGGSSDDDDDDDDSEEDDSDASELPELPEHVRRAAMQASSDDDDDDSDGDGPGGGKFGAGGWGKNRSSYYNADTADLEIGQEFEDAEAEEEAALELQRASYKRLDPADYGEEEEEEEEGEGDEAAETAKQERGGKGKGKGKTAAKRRERDGTSSAAGAQGEALRAMKSDLEQIALGAGGEVETSVVKRDTSKLSRRDKLELVLSEAPELPALLGEVRAQLGTLTESVQPLVSNVTAEIGASKDGMVYLRTRQQLLLAYCMNVCFYMVLKAKGEPAKGHPVVRRLLSLRGLLEDMSSLDDKMSSQVDLLLRALRSGVDLAGGSDNEEEEEEEGEEGQSDGGRGVSAANGRGKSRVAANGGSGGSSAEEEGEDVDEEGLEEEEARFMGGVGGGSSDEDEDGGTDGPPGSSKGSKKKKRRRAAREKAVEEARAKLAAGADGTSDALLGDFGDEDMDERPAMRGSGGGNMLQGMVNRISQRDQAATARKGRGLQGDLDVPVRERDQTIRVRRPAPGEDSDVEEGGSADSEDDDFLGGGGGGFMDGLPPGLLEGLSRSGGDGRKTKKKEGKRGRDGGGKGAAEDEEDGFYASVAEEKERKKRAKKDKYEPQARIAGALEAELEAERAARGETKRGASYTIIKNRGLTPHKNKLNRNPRSKKREAFRKATIRRKGQVRGRR